MDANESVDNPKSDISHLFTETDLVNLHHHRYLSLCKPATHQRGSKAINLIVVSPLVMAALLHAWIHPFGDPATIKGDHCLIGIDLNPEVLFGQAYLRPCDQQVRGTNSRYAHKVNKFCKQVIKKGNDNHLAQRIAALQALPRLDQQNKAELEAIDACLTKILLQADRACTNPNPAAWSPDLNQAYLRHRLWNLKLTAHCTKRNMSNVLTSIRN